MQNHFPRGQKVKEISLMSHQIARLNFAMGLTMSALTRGIKAKHAYFLKYLTLCILMDFPIYIDKLAWDFPLCNLRGQR